MATKPTPTPPVDQPAETLDNLEDRLAQFVAQLHEHQRVVFVAVVVITCGKKILTVYNENWRSFTLPMTKQREWMDPAFPKRKSKTEDWPHAAARAATEWLGGLVTTEAPGKKGKARFPQLKEGLTAAQLRQGDRDGLIKQYHFKVFQVGFEQKPKVLMDGLTKWLSVDEILDEQLDPISGTARFLIGRLCEKAKKQKKCFP